MSNQKGNQAPVKEEYVLEVDNKVKLDFPERNGYTTTYELTKAVNELLSKLFIDFFGSTFVVQNGVMYLKMYFYEPDARTLEENSEMLRAFLPRQFDKSDNIGKVVMNMTKAFTSKRKYIETEEGFNILKRYYFGGNDKDFKLDQYVSETINPSAMGGIQASYPLIEVFGFDVNKICRDIIENISDKDEISISVIKPLQQINNFVDMALKFTLINTRQFEEIGNKFGLINQNIMGNSNIILAKSHR